MTLKAVHSWKLIGLVGAFLELFIAYFLLCIAAFAFLPSKLLSVFGIYVPCFCSGVFGYQDSNLCWHKLLIEWPATTILSIQELVKSRFPFDQSYSLCLYGHRNSVSENGFAELEREGCSSSFSSPRLRSFVDREGGYDAKGKKIVNHKQKSVIRRRKRASLGYGKLSSFLSSSSTYSTGSVMRSEINDNLDPITGIEDGLLDHGNAPSARLISGGIQHALELGGSTTMGEGIDKIPSNVDKFTCNVEGRLSGIEKDANTISKLEQALEEEKAARVALFHELEKERAAAASAADEAMAMIFRLQEDKASIEMEARQYQRMIEEKFSYDEEEMNILKEILVRREREIHFLEKEVEAYQQMSFSGGEQVESDSNHEMISEGDRPSLSLELNETPLSTMQQIEKSESISEKEVATSTNGTSINEKNLHFSLDSSSSELQKSVNVVEKEKAERNVGMMSQVIKVSTTCCSIGKELENDGECWNKIDSDVDGSLHDTESVVYDVHVIDDKTMLQKEDNGKESGSLHTTASDPDICSGKVLSDCPSTSMVEIESNKHGSNKDADSGLSGLADLQCKTLGIDSQSNSSSSVNDERLKIDSEVEWLRERLRVVQNEKEKLTLSAEHRERINVQLKLVEEILNQLREIQNMREPLRQASLPPSSSEVSLKKRRCQSVPWETFESA